MQPRLLLTQSIKLLPVLRLRGTRTMSSIPRVYVTRPDVDASGLELLRKSCNVSTWKEALPVPREVLLREVAGCEAVYCALTDKIDAEVLDAAGSQLKCVSTISVGYEHIDVEECRKRGIRVGFTPDVLTDATAELTLALLLATNRRLFEASKQVYNGGWKSWAPMWMCGQGLKGSRVGLLGFGRIGQEIAARIFPFKPAEITYTTRTARPQEAAAVNGRHVDFDEMLRNSDFIVACCALTPETKEIFNAGAFKKMKPNCIFINTARGGVVDQKALHEALESKRILAAGLDVTTPEPLPLDDPLLKLDNVVILPHIGSADIETRKEMSRITARNILAALTGGKMEAEVTV
ncbi:glyoxylate reductase/hydroxypyruvate reductase [Drosophila pseudoobscura]|uniref:Glyoxylate reductase/hydroxypyruvate reductase n=1 Tax=Drosophila pseudoobscura pseudoobscura TaxID=46245 RepID=A0A6I8UQ18_DROPS|nr:glyoxylate reductase/hydroxypyruvate reductase [Drosophila pseudoobscura]